MKKIALALALTALGGCAMSQRVGGPGGPHADYAISCPAGQMELCFSEARRVCPKGYDVVSLNRLNTGEAPLITGTMVLKDHITVRCET
jgi:hypothetical protein